MAVEMMTVLDHMITSVPRRSCPEDCNVAQYHNRQAIGAMGLAITCRQ